MLTRSLHHAASCAVVALSAVLCSAANPLRGDDAKPTVSLLLTEASAKKFDRDTIITCQATLENDTGRELSVRTGFSSVFDGLELVVTTKSGKVLAQQAYTLHQSPFSFEPRTLPLKQAGTEAKLAFPIRDLPADVKSVKVRLIGTLPDSGYRWTLSTETIEVEIK